MVIFTRLRLGNLLILWDRGLHVDVFGAWFSGYSWDMVHEMEETCRTLEHPITFPVRAALLAQSLSQLSWLLQQSDR